ncbi:MAG: NAD-dependent epimerase/dehydratase family protein [Gemmatimonadota bacterium]
MLAFLTGATGFIGGRLAVALHARGYSLRCLVRSPARAGALRSLGAELIVADICDEDALARGMAGATAAWHVAGLYDIGVVDERALEHVNVEGTRAFLRALRASDVRRAVHVSSTAALGPAGATGEADEDSVYEGPYPSVYHRTKTAAHRLAREAQAEGAPLVIVCPALVYGPGDTGPSGRYIEDVLRHRVPGLSTRPTLFSYVYIDDVADGLVAAGERGRPGRTYVLSGENATVNDLTLRIAELAGTRVSPLRLPPAAIRLTGILLDWVSRRTGKRLPVSRELAQVAAMGERWVHSRARASAELGYAPRPLADGLPFAVRFTQQQLAR